MYSDTVHTYASMVREHCVHFIVTLCTLYSDTKYMLSDTVYTVVILCILYNNTEYTL